ncbi:MAG: LmeA family phospholipid-binding protein [Chloroflexota bacterium]
MSNQHYAGILALAVATLACSVFVGGPSFPDPPIPNSPEALQSLQADLEKAVFESLTEGTLRLTITQEQLTAYLASRLSMQDPPLITEPQVVLGEQEMVVYGRARAGIFEANLAVTAQFAIDQSGQPEFRISDAELGPLPMPQALRDSIAAAVDEALTGYIGPVAIGFRLESIEISSGIMTITGRLR